MTHISTSLCSMFSDGFADGLRRLCRLPFRLVGKAYRKLYSYFYILHWYHAWKIHDYCTYAVESNAFHADLQAMLCNASARSATQHDPVHLLLCTSSLSPGGAERQWCYLALELAHRGYAVTLLVDNLEGACGHYLYLLDNSPVRVVSRISLSAQIPFDLSYKHLMLPEVIFRYFCLFHVLRPTHVFAQLDYTNVVCGVSFAYCTEFINKILLSFRNVNPSHFDYIYAPWFLPIYTILAQSDRVVLNANSRVGGDDYAAWMHISPERVHIAHNAVMIPPESPGGRKRLRASLGITADAPVVLGVMRLSTEKNPQLFVNVACRIVQKMPDAHIVLVGAGPLADTLRDCIEKRGLTERFSLLSGRQDMPDIMRAADVLLLTSNWEGMPNVLLEAQAVALPVVATRVGGVPEAVQDGVTGMLAEKDDINALEAHCLALLRDPGLRQRMGSAGRHFVASQFSTTALCDAICAQVGLPPKPTMPSSFPPPLGCTLPLTKVRLLMRVQHLLAECPKATCRPLVVFTNMPLPAAILALLPPQSVCLALPGIDMPEDVRIRHIDWRVPDGWQTLEGTLPPSAVALVIEEWPHWKHLDWRMLRLGVGWAIYADEVNWFLFPFARVRFLRTVWGIGRTFRKLLSRVLRKREGECSN